MNFPHEIAIAVILLGGVFLAIKAFMGTYQKQDRVMLLMFSFFILAWGVLAAAAKWAGQPPAVYLFHIELARKLVSGSLLGMFLSMCIYGAWKRL